MNDDRATWREARFDTAETRGRAIAWTAAATVVAVVGNFVVLLAAMQNDENRCGQNCYDTGLRPYERGHGWTSYDGSWQWEGMLVLAVVALLTALAAAVMIWRERPTERSARALPIAALALGVAWVAWRVLAPPVHP